VQISASPPINTMGMYSVSTGELRLCGESVNAKDCKGWEFPTKEANKIIANDNNFAHGDYALVA
tara:strand:- start:276 stop:467 length:192 start_codon:yes stop_codon:yes gene_type:complete